MIRKFSLYISISAITLVVSSAFAQTTLTSNQAKPKPPITIEAGDFLEWNQTDGTYIAKGKAYVEQGSANIRADHIIANYDANGPSRDLTRIIANGSVVYVDGDSNASGSKLDYDINAKRYKLTGSKALLTGPKGDMSADKSIIYDFKDSAQRMIIGTGNARYENTDGRVIFGDKLVALLDAEGTVQTVEAYDNTKVITANGITATADRLDYIASASLANLYGNVEIIDQGNIMRGAKAEIDFDKNISRILSNGSEKRVNGLLTPK